MASYAQNFLFYGKSGHGHQGKHYYNPLSGESLSVREYAKLRHAQYLREGIVGAEGPKGSWIDYRKQGINPKTGKPWTVEDILVKQQQPISVTKEKGGWRATSFYTLSGAKAYAQRSKNYTYIVARGSIWIAYGNEDENDEDGERGYITLTGKSRRGQEIGNISLEEMWQKMQEKLVPTGHERFIVMEYIEDETREGPTRPQS
jgi:hypothetical protein